MNNKYDSKALQSEISAYCRWHIEKGICDERDCETCAVKHAYDTIQKDAKLTYVVVHICNIQWDADEEMVDLPKDIYHSFAFNNEESELDDIVSDWLSDEYGYCHKGFSVEA